MARVHYHHEFPKGWNGNVMAFPDRILQPNHWKKPCRVAVGLMGDIFHKKMSFGLLDHIWATMGCCELPDLRHLTFQILTKRPDRMLEYAKYRAESGMVFGLPNLWVGVSVEDQETANIRIPILNDHIKAVVKFVSLEPLLGPVIFRNVPGFNRIDLNLRNWWIIVGGESGPGSRPMNPNWVRSIRDQCQVSGVPFHFKGWGDWAQNQYVAGNAFGYAKAKRTLFDNSSHKFAFDDQTMMERVGKKAAGRMLDGHEWLEFPEVA
jgi:protein gp37